MEQRFPHNEYATDEDSADLPPIRTRSLSENEVVGNRFATRAELHSDDSFDYNESPIHWSHSQSGLHHRHTLNRDDDKLDGEFRSSSREPRNSKYKRQRQMPNRSSGKFLCKPWIRYVLIAIFVGYLFLVFRIFHVISSSPTEKDAIRIFPMPMEEKRTLQRHLSDEKEQLVYNQARNEARHRATERRDRTRPRPQTPSLPWYPVLTAEQAERATFTDADTYTDTLKKNRPAPMEQLCGFHAQNSALAYPDSYLGRDAINSESRVLITGILSPVGFHLALRLKHRCGAQVITGLDAMLPNTVQHRLGLLEQLEILATNLPELERPIIETFLGLDPKKKSSSRKLLDATNELDLMQWKPTHIVHLQSYGSEIYPPPQWKNLQSPYVSEYYNPLFLSIRSNMVAMEQLLASIAMADAERRPHMIYASSNLVHRNPPARDDIWQSQVGLMDEILADAYYSAYGIYSVGMRLPNGVYGPWEHSETSTYKIMDTLVLDKTLNDTLSADSSLDLVYTDDVVDALIAAMQFRSPSSKPATFEVTSGETWSPVSIHEAAKAYLSKSVASPALESSPFQVEKGAVFNFTQQYLDWSTHTPLEEGLVRSIAWHLDRANPYGSPPARNASSISTGDKFLASHSLSTCAAEDFVCHSGLKYLPCASECSTKARCVSSAFDDMIPLVQEVTEGCDIVLYTQALGDSVSDMKLQSEFMEEGNPLICNFAFVSSGSKLVDSVLQKVPNAELARLGVAPLPEDEGKPGAIHKRKLEKLNGRLLYRGWILLWTDNSPDPFPHADHYLLKLSPGRFFSKDVKYGMFIEQDFPVTPTADDVKFLVHEMHRPAWDQRIVKRKTQPKAKFHLPAEPRRRAVILVSRLKYEDSLDYEPLPPDSRITIREAARFMRFEKGEAPLRTEPPEVRRQREFYERIPSRVNRVDALRSPMEPAYHFQMHHWARTRWVLHDMQLEESRQLRCDWYQEHIQWGSHLDQLSLAHAMAKREIERRIAHEEPDDTVLKRMSEKTAIKRLLSDANEWHAIQTEQNKLYTPDYELEVLPYDLPDADIDKGPETVVENGEAALFVRIMSDRIMAVARKAWNYAKSNDHNSAKDGDS